MRFTRHSRILTLTMTAALGAGVLALGAGASGASGATGLGAATGATDTSPVGPDPARRSATAWVAAHSRGLAARGQTAHVVRTLPSGGGGHYVAYEQELDGLPVIGGDFVVPVDRDGTVLREREQRLAPLSVETTPLVTPARAGSIARSTLLRGDLGRVERVRAPVLSVLADGRRTALVYRVVVEGQTPDGSPSIRHTMVDARTGAVLGSWDQVIANRAAREARSPRPTGPAAYRTLTEASTPTGASAAAPGTGKGYYYKTAPLDVTERSGSYELTDPKRPGVFCGVQGNAAISKSTSTFGNGSGTDMETACVDALYSVQRYWDMLDEWYGWKGFDGKGKGFPLFTGLKSVNAYWNGHTVSYGHTKDEKRQLTDINIAVHEFGHAVYQYTPGGFDGYGEQYQLNEGTSDIWGHLVEWYANHPDDTPDYDYAEMSDAFNRGPERNLYNASLTPRKMPICWTPTLKDTEIHDGSGVVSHVFYLIAKGNKPADGPESPICAGGPASIQGLGMQRAGRIWLETLMTKTSFWEYGKARVSSLTAVTQLYPTDCQAWRTVKGAWDGIAVPPQSGEPGPPAGCPADPGPTATATPTVTPTPTPTPTPTASPTATPSPTPTGECGTPADGTMASGGTATVPVTVTRAGTVTGCLSGPADTDFDLYLQLLTSGRWRTVASSAVAGSTEKVSYAAGAGDYRFLVTAYSGSGAYRFSYRAP